jgi:prolipoprotein diacylglyceryl transferase
MLLYIDWDINPILFKLGFFEIRYYSLLFAASFYFGYKIFFHYFKETKKDPKLVEKLLVYIIVAVVAGARLGHCLFYEPEYYLNHFWEMILPFDFSNGIKFTGFRGLASHGAAIGILVSTYLFCKKYKFSYLWIIDKLVIVIALAGFFIRTGNLMNSEIIGAPTNMPWAFIFTKIDQIPRHPAQFYEALAYLGIFLFLVLSYKQIGKKIYNGFLFGAFMILIFSARFFIEFVKENQVDFEEGMTLNMGQILSIPLVLAGVIVLIYSFKKKDLSI